jgi:hypothetical protein
MNNLNVIFQRNESLEVVAMATHLCMQQPIPTINHPQIWIESKHGALISEGQKTR